MYADPLACETTPDLMTKKNNTEFVENYQYYIEFEVMFTYLSRFREFATINSFAICVKGVFKFLFVCF